MIRGKADKNKHIHLTLGRMFLTRAERDFLLQSEGMNRNKQRYIRYKLRRKIKHFYDNELPLLVKQGYIADNVAANSSRVAASSHNNNKSDNEDGAGSGTLASPSQSEIREGNISNPRVLSDMGLAIRKHTCLAVRRSNDNSLTFEDYLKSQNKRNIRQIISYAERYRSVLDTGDVSPLINLKSGAMRRHVMEALTALSKYLGFYDRWQEMRKRYQLHWTSGDESIKSLERFFNPDLTLDSIYDRVREMIAKTPVQIANIIRFACLTGLRPREVIESVNLINNPDSLPIYYN